MKQIYLLVSQSSHSRMPCEQTKHLISDLPLHIKLTNSCFLSNQSSTEMILEYFSKFNSL